MSMDNMNGRSDEMKVVYLWKNGQQVLVFSNNDGEYVYPKENWTEQKPPTGIYAPFYYDGQKWVGQSKEDFERNVEAPTVEPDEKDLVIATLSETVLSQQEEIKNVRKDIASILEILLSNGGTSNV